MPKENETPDTEDAKATSTPPSSDARTAEIVRGVLDHASFRPNLQEEVWKAIKKCAADRGIALVIASLAIVLVVGLGIKDWADANAKLDKLRAEIAIIPSAESVKTQNELAKSLGDAAKAQAANAGMLADFATIGITSLVTKAQENLTQTKTELSGLKTTTTQEITDIKKGAEKELNEQKERFRKEIDQIADTATKRASELQTQLLATSTVASNLLKQVMMAVEENRRVKTLVSELVVLRDDTPVAIRMPDLSDWPNNTNEYYVSFLTHSVKPATRVQIKVTKNGQIMNSATNEQSYVLKFKDARIEAEHFSHKTEFDPTKFVSARVPVTNSPFAVQAIFDVSRIPVFSSDLMFVKVFYKLDQETNEAPREVAARIQPP